MPGESAEAGGGCEPEEVPLTQGSPESWPGREPGQDLSSPALAHLPVCVQTSPVLSYKKQQKPSHPPPAYFTPSWRPPCVWSAPSGPSSMQQPEGWFQTQVCPLSVPFLFPWDSPGNEVLVILASSRPTPQLSHAQLLRSLEETLSHCTCCSC